MLSVPTDQFNGLNQTIKCWQYLLGWSTFLAAIFGIAVVVVDFKSLTNWQKLKLPLGIISGLFWVATVFCGNKVNTKTSQLQQKYADQTEDAEKRIKDLKPSVDSVQETVDALVPFVNDTLSPKVNSLTNAVRTIKPQVVSIASQVKSLGPTVIALIDNANRIRTFRLELSYPQDSFRRDSIENLDKGYFSVGNLGPEIRCDGMTIPLYPLYRSVENDRTNVSTNIIYFDLVKPDQLEGKRIGILDTCHTLSINILGLQINNEITKTTHSMFYAIKYLDVQLVINGMYLNKIYIDTPKSYWTPRIEDAGFVTFNLESNPLKLSQQYTRSYNSRSDSANQSH